jgi:hypothetical protein
LGKRAPLLFGFVVAFAGKKAKGVGQWRSNGNIVLPLIFRNPVTRDTLPTGRVHLVDVEI